MRVDHLSRLPGMPPSTFDVNWLQVELPNASRSNSGPRIPGRTGQLPCPMTLSTSLSVAGLLGRLMRVPDNEEKVPRLVPACLIGCAVRHSV